MRRSATTRCSVGVPGTATTRVARPSRPPCTTDQLKLKELVSRLHHGVEEVIVATDPTVEGEGDGAVHHPSGEAARRARHRIAQGLPMGGDLEYADQVTLARALQGRREI